MLNRPRAIFPELGDPRPRSILWSVLWPVRHGTPHRCSFHGFETAHDRLTFLLPLDHSKLAEARELAQQVEKRIRTLQKMMDHDRQLAGEIPVEAENRPVQQRFDDYFKNQ